MSLDRYETTMEEEQIQVESMSKAIKVQEVQSIQRFLVHQASTVYRSFKQAVHRSEWLNGTCV